MDPYFRFTPPWSRVGDNPYPWVDAADGLFGPDDLFKLMPLLGKWKSPRLFTSAPLPVVDVYCTPAGHYVFSGPARNVLSEVVDGYVEWLPVDLVGFAGFSLLHPLRTRAFGKGARYSINAASKNITRIDAFDFDPEEASATPIFYPAQASGSAAQRAGFCCHDIVVSDAVAVRWQRSKLMGIRLERANGPVGS